MPSLAALERGAAAAAAVLVAHRQANEGAWPETVAVNLWGLDSIKTKVGKGADGGGFDPVSALGVGWRDFRLEAVCPDHPLPHPLPHPLCPASHICPPAHIAGRVSGNGAVPGGCPPCA